MTERGTPETGAEFDLEAFLPFILNQTAEVIGKSFQAHYRAAYGMTRTQWRVLAIVGRYGGLTASDICAIAHEEKSRVSRAVAALEERGMLSREISPEDKRAEILSLSAEGAETYRVLGQAALAFDQALRDRLGPEAETQLRDLLQRLRSVTGGAEKG
ncbi:MarR family transcriptional regulator [Salipiger sp. P9]|uniref:MarR family winged helix-turn-helix transcriptional regulator n=1 Tax=Salipiger pentaromativorans TaxID=2943193 RepID=UPI002157BB56|nr:MarR family transcriptional regulator [Salipiger pentaromativorans]MCR8550614.1 MarR family transcriptional regulator [Salipiger pentaromativorans]